MPPVRLHSAANGRSARSSLRSVSGADVMLVLSAANVEARKRTWSVATGTVALQSTLIMSSMLLALPAVPASVALVCGCVTVVLLLVLMLAAPLRIVRFVETTGVVVLCLWV